MTSSPAAGRGSLFVGELAMRRRSRVQDQAARVADIGQMREQPHALDQLDAGLVAALDAEGEHRARAFRQILLRELVIRAVLEAGVGNPGDLRVPAQKFGDLERILDMPLHPHVQGLDAGDRQERVHRRERRAEIAQGHRPRLHGEGEVAEILEELEAVIGRLRIGQRRESGRLATSRTCPNSTTTPPSALPWPDRNLVVEWTTMSAPCSIGRQR